MPMGPLGHARSLPSDDDTNAYFRTESQSFLHGARNCGDSRVRCFCLPLKDRKGQWRRLSALTRIAFELNQTQDRP